MVVKKAVHRGEELGWRGPVVGMYSVVVEGELYDLQDHYSMPRVVPGTKCLVRSPVEAAVNMIAFLVLAVLAFLPGSFGLGRSLQDPWLPIAHAGDNSHQVPRGPK